MLFSIIYKESERPLGPEVGKKGMSVTPETAQIKFFSRWSSANIFFQISNFAPKKISKDYIIDTNEDELPFSVNPDISHSVGV